MSQGFTTAPLSNISNVANLQAELDSKASLSGATFVGTLSGAGLSFTSISGGSIYSPVISGTSITSTNFFGNGSNLTGLPTVFTGVTFISFDSFTSGETSYTSTAVTDSNITTNSNIMFSFSASTHHPDVEDSLLDGLILKESNLNPGVGFTLNATAGEDTWGIYTVKYKIIN